MKIKKLFTYPEEVKEISIKLGIRIRTARIRRRISQQDLANRSGLSRSTIQSIERGDVTYVSGNLFHVLWILGLSNEVSLIADPGLDRDGLALALDVQSKRVYVKRVLDNDF